LDKWKRVTVPKISKELETYSEDCEELLGANVEEDSIFKASNDFCKFICRIWNLNRIEQTYEGQRIE
jgi:hypothetical protein